MKRTETTTHGKTHITRRIKEVDSKGNIEIRTYQRKNSWGSEYGKPVKVSKIKRR